MEQRKPAISVIIIFLNAEKFIGEAIDSVFAQTEKDWELLLVDDGSTDDSAAIAKGRAAEAPSRVRYLRHPGNENRGMSASRNLGIREARGEFIAVLDADDVWMPTRLERHLGILRAHEEVGMVYGPTLYWHSWSDEGGTRDTPRNHVGELSHEPGRPVSPPDALLSFLQTGGRSVPGICSLLARRHVVQSVGGFEESFRGLYEDQVFLSKMCFKTTIFIHHEVLDKYRQHPASHCYQAIDAGDFHPIEPHPARERYLVWLEKYLRSEGAGESELMMAVEQELWPYRHSWVYSVRSSTAFRFARRSLRRSLSPTTYAWLHKRWGRHFTLGSKI